VALDLYNRIRLHQDRLEKIRQNNSYQNEEWFRIANVYEKKAVAALALELQGRHDEAKKLWQELREAGLESFDTTRKVIDMPANRPWVQLAMAKLQSGNK
jgi:hypothetical protein